MELAVLAYFACIALTVGAFSLMDVFSVVLFGTKEQRKKFRLRFGPLRMLGLALAYALVAATFVLYVNIYPNTAVWVDIVIWASTIIAAFCLMTCVILIARGFTIGRWAFPP